VFQGAVRSWTKKCKLVREERRGGGGCGGVLGGQEGKSGGGGGCNGLLKPLTGVDLLGLCQVGKGTGSVARGKYGYLKFGVRRKAESVVGRRGEARRGRRGGGMEGSYCGTVFVTGSYLRAPPVGEGHRVR
jgi:hypothetical protein